ncbi:phage major capsid protein [Sphingomonas cannabina]|uniref:phage major capsid protein n=1 Tax=Sphingomonas cannabina TaxID=2899123 RepID=UPI001F24B852|nr:phage major capsid protein [Sphingomonas cannabina]UIJ43790.1 phage major capsid protein [Sphingomonas cannabina]
MSINPDRNYGQLLTAAVARRSRAVQNIVYNSTPLTAILMDQNRIRTKRAGGPELRIPVQFDKLTAQWFTGYDKIEITPKELLNSAVFPWSRVVSPFSLNGTEMLFTGGEEEIIDLMEFYLNTAEQGVKEEFETSLVGDGTAAGGRQMIGLGGAIPVLPNTGIYGGIDRASVANWRTSTFNIVSGDVAGYTTWDSTTVRPIIDRIALARSRNGRYAKLLIADALAYEPIASSFVAHQRIVSERSERLGRLGFSGLTYITPAGPVDIVAAGGIGNVMPANTVFGIDEEGLSIWEFPNQSFVPFHPGNGLRPINQDAIAQGIVWSGQLVLENPLFSYRIRTTS